MSVNTLHKGDDDGNDDNNSNKAYEGFVQLQDYQLLRVKLRGVVYCFVVHSQSLRKATSTFAMSVCPSAWNNSAPTGRICVNPLHAELNPICHLLALLGAHHILHISRIRVKYDVWVFF